MDMLMYLGWGIMIIGYILFLIAAFSEGILWGLGCFFLAPVSLVFLIVRWSQAKKGFLMQLLGMVIVVASIAMGADFKALIS